jgi:hypothetical protein
VKTSSLDSVAKALSSLNDVYNKDPKLAVIMQAPTLSDDDKSAIVNELRKHTGGQDKADTVKNFLDTLAENNRLGLLKGVCEKFGELMGAARGEIELTVTSASVRFTISAFGVLSLIISICSNWMARLCPAWSLQLPNPSMLARDKSSR